MQTESRSIKRHKLPLYGCPVFSSKVRPLIVWVLSRCSGTTASSQPISTFSKQAANTGKFVKLTEFRVVFTLFLLHDSMTSVLSRLSFSFARSSLVHIRWDSVVFVWEELSESSIFYNSQSETQEADSLLLHNLCWWRRYQASRPLSLHWRFILHELFFVSSPFNFRILE